MKRTLAKALAILFVALLFGLGTETASQLAYRLFKGTWYFHDRQSALREMVEPHAYFGVCLTASTTQVRNGLRFTHNSFRCRSPEFARPKPAGVLRVVALGGSSTYCIGVSDEQTWPAALQRLLAAPHEVVNMGIPGATSIETMAQTALLFSEVQPDFALYYLGWNDARVQHIKNLSPDWSDYHGRFQISHALLGAELRERTATGYLVKRALFHQFFPGLDMSQLLRNVQGTDDKFTDRVDQRAIGLYERNLREIAALCRKQSVRPIFIPQLLNYASLTSDKPYGWLPFVRDRDLRTIMAAYNERMAKVAADEGVVFASEVLDEPFDTTDFVDNGHFSAAGNERFARTLAGTLARAKTVPKI